MAIILEDLRRASLRPLAALPNDSRTIRVSLRSRRPLGASHRDRGRGRNGVSTSAHKRRPGRCATSSAATA